MELKTKIRFQGIVYLWTEEKKFGDIQTFFAYAVLDARSVQACINLHIFYGFDGFTRSVVKQSVSGFAFIGSMRHAVGLGLFLAPRRVFLLVKTCFAIPFEKCECFPVWAVTTAVLSRFSCKSVTFAPFGAVMPRFSLTFLFITVALDSMYFLVYLRQIHTCCYLFAYTSCFFDSTVRVRRKVFFTFLMQFQQSLNIPKFLSGDEFAGS